MARESGAVVADPADRAVVGAPVVEGDGGERRRRRAPDPPVRGELFVRVAGVHAGVSAMTSLLLGRRPVSSRR
ncbi:hypothetical protein AB0G82_12765 [Streptomyces anulatus]|uniref:hypothetical protein n=1 Tax=Streptomyces anulatus TaxID=1892 RepID=UPI0033EEA097